MIRTSRHLLLAACLTAASAAVLAQAPAPAPVSTSASSAMQQRMAERHEQRMAQLKTQLDITPAQEAAWTAFTATMQPPTAPQRMNRDELNNLTAPQRVDLMEQRLAERQEWMQRRGEAIKTFYAVLSPEQQKTFDQHVDQMQGPQGKPRGMQRGQGRGWQAR
jgi:Spy/CpxP family protein refolding chaperone